MTNHSSSTTRAERLLVLMQEHSLTAPEVADITGHKPSTVYGWINGSANLPQRNLDHLELKLQLRGTGREASA